MAPDDRTFVTEYDEAFRGSTEEPEGAPGEPSADGDDDLEQPVDELLAPEYDGEAYS